MALAVGNISSGQVGAQTTLTISHTHNTGDGGVLVVNISSLSGGPAPTSVTFNGVEATKISAGLDTGVEACLQYVLANPATGTHDVVITYAAAKSFGASVISCTGAAASPVGATAAASGTTNNDAPTIALTTTVADSIVIDCVLLKAAATATVGAGQTQRTNLQINADGYILTSTEPKATPGSVTMNWSLSGAVNWTNSAIEIKPIETTMNVSVSDQLNITEGVSLTDIQNISVSDQLNMTESVTMLDIQNISVSDQLNITESVTLEANNFINVFDQLNITESVTIFINPLLISVSDQLNITESITTVLFQETLTLSVSDQLNLTESIQTGLDNYISVNDQLTVTESVSTSVQNNISVSDQINITESAIPGLTSFISASDQLNVTESVTMTSSDPVRGLSYMRGNDQNLPVSMTKQDYPLGFNDTSVS